MTEKREEQAVQEIGNILNNERPHAEQILRSVWALYFDVAPEEEVRRAWQYHAKADDLQHQRHIIFVLAQTIFFLCFAALGRDSILAGFLPPLGIVFAILWWRVADLLEVRLDAMRKLLKADRVWEIYIDAASQRDLFGGRHVFNHWLPVLTILSWGLLLASSAIENATLSRCLPSVVGAFLLGGVLGMIAGKHNRR